MNKFITKSLGFLTLSFFLQNSIIACKKCGISFTQSEEDPNKISYAAFHVPNIDTNMQIIFDDDSTSYGRVPCGKKHNGKIKYKRIPQPKTIPVIGYQRYCAYKNKRDIPDLDIENSTNGIKLAQKEHDIERSFYEDDQKNYKNDQENEKKNDFNTRKKEILNLQQAIKNNEDIIELKNKDSKRKIFIRLNDENFNKIVQDIDNNIASIDLEIITYEKKEIEKKYFDIIDNYNKILLKISEEGLNKINEIYKKNIAKKYDETKYESLYNIVQTIEMIKTLCRDFGKYINLSEEDDGYLKKDFKNLYNAHMSEFLKTGIYKLYDRKNKLHTDRKNIVNLKENSLYTLYTKFVKSVLLNFYSNNKKDIDQLVCENKEIYINIIKLLNKNYEEEIIENKKEINKLTKLDELKKEQDILEKQIQDYRKKTFLYYTANYHLSLHTEYDQDTNKLTRDNVAKEEIEKTFKKFLERLTLDTKTCVKEMTNFLAITFDIDLEYNEKSKGQDIWKKIHYKNKPTIPHISIFKIGGEKDTQKARKKINKYIKDLERYKDSFVKKFYDYVFSTVLREGLLDNLQKIKSDSAKNEEIEVIYSDLITTMQEIITLEEERDVAGDQEKNQKENIEELKKLKFFICGNIENFDILKKFTEFFDEVKEKYQFLKNLSDDKLEDFPLIKAYFDFYKLIDGQIKQLEKIKDEELKYAFFNQTF